MPNSNLWFISPVAFDHRSEAIKRPSFWPCVKGKGSSGLAPGSRTLLVARHCLYTFTALHPHLHSLSFITPTAFFTFHPSPEGQSHCPPRAITSLPLLYSSSARFFTFFSAPCFLHLLCRLRRSPLASGLTISFTLHHYHGAPGWLPQAAAVASHLLHL